MLAKIPTIKGATMTQPTIEEVAGWMRRAEMVEEIRHLRSGASIKDARDAGETWYLRAAQVEAMGWRPIDEAPKDGTHIDLWNSSAKKRLTDCRWDGNNRWVRWDENAFGVMAWCVVKGEITHFMPLPQPPVKK